MQESHMDKKKTHDSQTRILYVTLAALIVTVMIVSVITAVSKRNKEPSAPLDTEAQTDAPVTKYYPPVQQIKPSDTDETQTPVTEPPVTETKPTETEAPKEDKPTANRAFTVPVEGSVMKDFSVDMPVYSLTMDDYRAHKGVDISAEYGSGVFSFTDGVIEKVFVDPMLGVTVTVDHGEGLKTNYCGLQQTLPDGVEAGVTVKAGDVIGAVGDTTLVELSESSHLHFEVIKDGEYVDPAEYLPVLGKVEE